MPNKTPSYKDKVSEQFQDNFVFDEVEFRSDISPVGVEKFILKALDEQAELIYREWASHLPEQASKELLKSKGLI